MNSADTTHDAEPRSDDKPHWLNRRRLFVYPRMMLALLLTIGSVWIFLSRNMVDIEGKPLGYDFITFWAASFLAQAGHAPDAYNISLIYEAEKLAVPASPSVFVWYYPPPFYLVILPLALLHYLAAYWAFVLSTLTCYVLVLRRIVQGSTAMWCLAAFSGLWMNLYHGQNAFLTAAIVGGALLCLERRPILAGILIGLLAIKPHLALLFPLALLIIGAWRSFAAAAVTAVGFTLASTVLIGVDSLKASLGSLGYARTFLEGGFLPWSKMPTTFAFLRLLGAPVTLAYLGHALVAAGAVYAMSHVWRRSPDWPLRGAALMTATFMISPYVFDYDLAWLAFPIAWLSLAGLRDGWLCYEREILVIAWLLPLVMSPIASAVPVQIGPWTLGALLWVAVRRASRPTASGFDAVSAGRAAS